MCLLCCVMYNTYNELSSLFSCQIGLQCVVGWVLLGGMEEREQYKYNIVVLLLLPYIEFVRYRVVSSVSVCVCVCVCVCNMIDTEKNIISDYNMERKRKKQRNDIIKK